MTSVVNVLAVIGALTVLVFVVAAVIGWQVARDLKRREFGQ
jgi:hypothetical protein